MSDDDFERQFGTEEACRDFLFRRRWPTGFECSWCGSSAFRWLNMRSLVCLSCRKKTWLTAGTILHRTRKPLRLWFRAAYLMAQKGASARMLQVSIGLTYKVAWTWAQKLRQLLALETTLEAPTKPYPYRWDNAASRALWNTQYGQFTWDAVVPPMPTCCGRFRSIDWNDDGFERWWSMQNMFVTTSGSLGVKHLDAYLRMMEFRVNHRLTPECERAQIVMGRFARVRPLPYKTIVGEPASRAAIHMVWKRTG
jgi:hypothetical protein